MADPYIGEIKMFGGNFAPVGYAFCNGQLLNISDNDALFMLIGTTYGGDGQTTFGLPNLQGRIPVHQGILQGTSYPWGQVAGTETVTLNSQQLALHNHPVACNSDAGSSDNPSGNFVAATQKNFFSTSAPTASMGNAGIGLSAGGNQPHDNMMPYLCISFIIALEGIFPTQN